MLNLVLDYILSLPAKGFKALINIVAEQVDDVKEKAIAQEKVKKEAKKKTESMDG